MFLERAYCGKHCISLVYTENVFYRYFNIQPYRLTLIIASYVGFLAQLQHVATPTMYGEPREGKSRAIQQFIIT